MKIAGIITEYNPLHYGHLRLLEAVRAQYGPDTGIVCAMSGDFVQRGDFAILRRHARAEAAVKSGADLILELPLPWCVSSAEGFAQGGVDVLLGTGCLDVLAFGSECGNAQILEELAQALSTPAYDRALRAELDRGDSFAAARQRGLSRLLSPRKASLLAEPNNNLAVEYSRALLKRGADVERFTIPRFGAAHDAELGAAGGYSASAIRRLLELGETPEALRRMALPMRDVYAREEAAGRAPVFSAACERAILSRLRSMTEADFDALDTGREGIGRRLYNASREAVSVAGILDAAKAKRYAHARLRRMLLRAYLGLTTADVPAQVPYLRVLAANERGCRILAQMRKSAPIPVVTKPAAIRHLGPEAQRLFDLECRGADLYALAYPDLTAAKGGELWRQGPILI